MINNLQMTAIYIRDMTRAVEFYTEKLGFVKVGNTNEVCYNVSTNVDANWR